MCLGTVAGGIEVARTQDRVLQGTWELTDTSKSVGAEEAVVAMKVKKLTGAKGGTLPDGAVHQV